VTPSRMIWLVNAHVSLANILGVVGASSASLCAFDVGTPFQRAVWSTLTKIPYAQTWSYKQVANSLGVKCYRAVGSACGRNPLEIIVPCHRVVDSRGLGGYSAGLDAKVYLLRLEADAVKALLKKYRWRGFAPGLAFMFARLSQARFSGLKVWKCIGGTASL